MAPIRLGEVGRRHPLAWPRNPNGFPLWRSRRVPLVRSHAGGQPDAILELLVEEPPHRAAPRARLAVLDREIGAFVQRQAALPASHLDGGLLLVQLGVSMLARPSVASGPDGSCQIVWMINGNDQAPSTGPPLVEAEESRRRSDPGPSDYESMRGRPAAAVERQRCWSGRRRRLPHAGLVGSDANGVVARVVAPGPRVAA